MAVKTGRRKRYTPEQKKKILDTAAKEGLTGEQVAKRFGVAQLTFYRWRGPVRAPRGSKSPALRGVGAAVRGDGLRQQVQAGVRAALPLIIKEEVTAYLNGILGPRKRGRPKSA